MAPRLTDAEWEKLTEGKPRPIAIYHEGDAQAYYEATDEERAAWNAYAQDEADAFDNHPHRDSYDSTAVFPGWNRDGKCTSWCPDTFFPEWLERRNQTPQPIQDLPPVVLTVKKIGRVGRIIGALKKLGSF